MSLQTTSYQLKSKPTISVDVLVSGSVRYIINGNMVDVGGIEKAEKIIN